MIAIRERPYNGQLGLGVLWVLKEYGKVSIYDISSIIKWNGRKIKDEIRRINDSILKLWINETRIDDVCFYELDPEYRKQSLIFLQNLSKKTWKFNSDIYKRLNS